MKISTPQNPLLADKKGIAINADDISASTVFGAPRSRKRVYVKLTRKESASTAIEQFTKKVDVFGFTKGQFSLIDLIAAVMEKTGPAHLIVSTWTAANADLEDVRQFILSGTALSVRFLLDFSFQRRQPAVAKLIRDTFGLENLRITRNHAKFFMLHNDDWTVTCKTSMNLNHNPRFENFDLSNDPALHEFLLTLMADIFKMSTSKKQSKATTAELYNQFVTYEGTNGKSK